MTTCSKCGKVLLGKEKSICTSCREKRKELIQKAFTGITKLARLAAPVLITVVSGRLIQKKDQ